MGNASAALRAQMEETFPEEEWGQCSICRGAALKRYLPEYMGKTMCAWCKTRNGRRLARYTIFIEAVAKKDCMNDEHDGEIYFSAGGPWSKPEYYCNLDCKCMPCVARRIL